MTVPVYTFLFNRFTLIISHAMHDQNSCTLFTVKENKFE